MKKYFVIVICGLFLMIFAVTFALVNISTAVKESSTAKNEEEETVRVSLNFSPEESESDLVSSDLEEQIEVLGEGDVKETSDVALASTTKQTTTTTTPTPVPFTPTEPSPPPLTNGTCPVSTLSCIPCSINDGHWACRVESGQENGYLGWSCQNNNPGNIRPSSFRETIIKNNGGPLPCGKRIDPVRGEYMIFEDKVYNFSVSHLDDHARKYMDIENWCGTDMTQAFTTKAGIGADHSSRVYKDLANYYIGDYAGATASNSNSNSSSGSTTNQTTSTKSTTEKVEHKNPYNFWLPALISFVTYMIYWRLTKWDRTKRMKIFNKNTFNFTFNTVMLLGLIPSVLFGFIMIAAYSYTSVKDINFDWLYWHVELSTAFGVLLVTHFFTRFKLYKAPLRIFTRRPHREVN